MALALQLATALGGDPPTLSNPSFESVDPTLAGNADAWTLTIIGSDGDAADYAVGVAGVTAPLEDFRGGWSTNESFVYAFTVPDDPLQLESAVYSSGQPTQTTVEDFETDWNNTAFLTAMGGVTEASYDANAYIESGIETFTVAVTDTLDVTTGGGTASSDAVTATPASFQAGTQPDGLGFAAGGEQVWIYYNGRGRIGVTFTTETTAAELAATINSVAAAEGLASELQAASYGINLLEIFSLVDGYGSAISVESVTKTDTWERIGYTSTQVASGVTGTGNVTLIDAATAADIVAIVNGSAALTAIGVYAEETPDARVKLGADPGSDVTVDSTGALGTALGFTLDTASTPPETTGETFEDFEDGWGDDYLENEANLIPSLGAETWTPADTSLGTVTSGQADPDGGTTAFLLTDRSLDGGQVFTGDAATFTGGPLRARLWAKKDTASPAYCRVGIEFDGTELAAFSLRQGTGDIDLEVVTQLDEVKIIEYVTGWWLLDIVTKSSAATLAKYRIVAAAGAATLFPSGAPVQSYNAGVTLFAPRMTELGATTLQSFAKTWADVDEDPGIGTEDFETSWNVDAFAYDWTTVTATAASYDTGAGGVSETVEDFEEVDLPFVTAPDFSSDVFTATAHGLSDGMVVQFSAINGALPTGLTPATDYYVIASTANTFQVSTTSGGAAVDFTDDGSGTLYTTPPGSVFWIDEMTTM